MKILKDLFADIKYDLIQGDMNREITDLYIDSRKVEAGGVFFCFIGSNSDGHDFIPDVIKKEPAAIVIEREFPEVAHFFDKETEGCVSEQDDSRTCDSSSEITIIRVSDCREALALASREYFGHPAEKLITIGVTGTKGKTSIVSMISRILEKSGMKCGTIGTVGINMGSGDFIPSKTTTPESYDVESYMRRMADEGCKAVVMEVSSQALMLRRVAGIVYDCAVFTNLSPDHIGGAEHKDFEDYMHCKSLLFKQAKHGFFNADDEHMPDMTRECACSVNTFSIENPSDLKASGIMYLRQGEFIGMSFNTSGSINGNFKVSAPGEFSVYNALAAMSVCRYLGIGADVMKKALMEVHVRGRMEPVKISPRFHLLIDYAHNAMAMESILKAFRKYNPKRLVSVFGCGGNRSRIRRFEMGEISGRLADFSILTADNSRFEKVEDIIADIEVGMKKTDGEYIIIPDRKEAIKYSIEHAEPGDIILLLGKGHEDYQEIEGVRRPFDERVIIAGILEEIKGC